MDVVIGIGNPLRGDDGIGPRVAGELAPTSSVEVRVVHQLTPDMALWLKDAARVLFVDAGVDGEAARVRRIHPSSRGVVGHSLSPEALLGWTEWVYERAPEAWLLAVPGRSFDVAEGLSREVERAVPAAVEAARTWIRGEPGGRTREEEA